MNGAFYIGATGLQSQQRALDVVANNIANLNTPAFKRSEVRFSELLPPAAAGDVEALLPADALAALSGVSATASARVFSQGELRQTGQPMDVAIEGRGFIELMGPGGQTYLWRGGSLKVDADGYLATSQGLPLKAMISVPIEAKSISIDRDGLVRAQGDSEVVEMGQIDIVLAKDIDGLAAVGDGLYQTAEPTDLVTVAPGDEGSGAIVQGSVETSNVQLSDEMVSLLLLQRAYAANAQVLQAGDQLMAIANNLKR